MRDIFRSVVLFGGGFLIGTSLPHTVAGLLLGLIGTIAWALLVVLISEFPRR